jgi:L-ascorbate metabolism protein UlaG (beta-lactamase superfamily)
MTITQFEQSGFIFQAENGFRLAVDIGNKTPIERLENVSADAMLVSHLHGDHFSLEQIQKISPKKLYLNSECIEIIGEESLSAEVVQIKTDETFSVDAFTVKTFTVDHGPNVSAPVKENFGFLISVDGITIYFAGDMFYESGIDVSSVEVAYALLPVGGFYTFGPQEAFNFAKKFKRIGKVIPMHHEKSPETKEQFITLAVTEGMNTES